MCKVLKIPRSTYYNSIKRKDTKIIQKKLMKNELKII
ncbi:Transposase [Staphylococcus aureus subsp. aureus DR10]|uniref:Transposase n=1 Tax=Staphylococcus aureus subsp. aureus DR10 TaxID=1155079 RepID=A0ABC9PX85_STAA5|nr:Transposase [Staphylococcus aureus subsp. aureus 71193]EIA13088.1 Transposase [Staphylococcus aureus subsp. aureus DR10]